MKTFTMYRRNVPDATHDANQKNPPSEPAVFSTASSTMGSRRCGREQRTPLAEAFLDDEPHLATYARVDELAALIQRTIEDYIAHEQSNYEPPDPPGFEAGFADNH